MDDSDIPKKPPSMWVPMVDPYELGLMTKLGEEAGELGSAASRCMAQGLDEAHPETGKINRHWLEDEIADIYSKFDEVVVGLGLDIERIQKGRKAKFEFHRTWFAFLRSRSPKYRNKEIS